MSFENLTESISSLIQSTTARCKENPQVTGIIVACAGIWITSKMYRIYGKNRLHDEEYETTNVDTPRARRLIFAKHFGPKLKFEGVTITEEYVQAPDGHILFTRCYVPKVYLYITFELQKSKIPKINTKNLLSLVYLH